MKQLPVFGSQHAPALGLQTNCPLLQNWPGTVVPPARAHVVMSRSWQALQQQHAGGCLEQLGNAAVHGWFGENWWPSWLHVPCVVMVQTNVFGLQHAPCTSL